MGFTAELLLMVERGDGPATSSCLRYYLFLSLVLSFTLTPLHSLHFFPFLCPLLLHNLTNYMTAWSGFAVHLS